MILSRSFISALLALAVLLNLTASQGNEREVGQTGNTIPPLDPGLMAELRSTHSDLPEQAALDIAALINTLKDDSQTTELIMRMKDGDGKKEYENFAKDMSGKEIVAALVQTLEEMKALEILFRDPARAVEEMNKEGMVPPGRLDAYRKNPALLDTDTRRSLHFTFVSLAAAGGFL